MLTLENLSCSRRGKRYLQVDALSAEKAQFQAVVGPNGAGKSTLFKAICGELSSSGSILLHGRPVHAWSAVDKARHLAVLPQATQITFPFTASEIVAMGTTPLSLGKRAASLQLREYMKLCDCWHLAEQSYLSLSGGERQRVQLARVLLQLSQAERAPLLLLDEPTSAQDLGQQHAVLALASRLCKEREFSIMAILHDLNHVMRYCDSCALLSKGQLLVSGRPEQVLSEESIERHWHYRPTRVNNKGRNAVFV